MYFLKNLPGWERALRVLVGLGLVVWGSLGGELRLVAVVAGIAFAGMGVVGWCPACAALGRRRRDA